MLSARMDDLRKEKRRGRSDGDSRVADEARAPMRDHGIGKKLQICIVGKRDGLRLRRVVGIHRVDLGCRLRGDVRLRAGAERDVESKPVSLQQAAGGRDQEHAGQVRHLLVAIQRALRHVGRTALEVRQDRAAPRRSKPRRRKPVLPTVPLFI